MAKINFLFLILCLPIITLPGASTALMTVSQRMALDEPGDAVHEFWLIFKAAWKKTILPGLYFPAILLTLLYCIWYISGGASGYLKIALLSFAFMGFLVHCFASYYYYLLAGIQITDSKQEIKPFQNSFVWALVGLKHNWLIFIIELLLLIGQIEIFPWGLFVLLIGPFAWSALIRSYLIKKYIYE